MNVDLCVTVAGISARTLMPRIGLTLLAFSASVTAGA
jgi:hypothetical protein